MIPIALRQKPTSHSAPITHVALDGAGRRLATSSYDGTVYVWKLRADGMLDTTPTHRLYHRRLVNASAWNPVVPDLLASASADKTVAVWCVTDGAAPSVVNVLARHTDDVNSVAWLPDGERLICVSEDGRATLWDAITGAFLREVGSHEAHCMMVAVSTDGLVATVGEDGQIIVTDIVADSAKSIRFAASVEGCSWSRDGRRLAVARDDGLVAILDRELTDLLTLDVSRSAARIVSWTSDDSRLVVGSYDGGVTTYDTSDGRLVVRIEDERLWPRSLDTHQDRIYVGSFTGRPAVISGQADGLVEPPSMPNRGPNAISHSGDSVFVGLDSGEVLELRAAGHGGGSILRALKVSDSPILSLATHDGRLYAGTYSGFVFSAPLSLTGNPERSDNLGAPVPSLTSVDGAVIAGTYNGELVSLDPTTLKVTRHTNGHAGSVKSLTQIEGTQFASASTDRTVAIGSVNERQPLWHHGNLLNAVAYGHGVLATASRDHTVKVGRLAKGPWSSSTSLNDFVTLIGADESVKCVSVLGSHESTLVVAGSYDFCLYVWKVDWNDRATPLRLGGRLAPFSQAVSCMTVLDEQSVVVASWDGSVQCFEAMEQQPWLRSVWSMDLGEAHE